MNSFSKFLVVATLLVSGATMAFAAPDRILGFNETGTPNPPVAGEFTVAPTPAIVSYFQTYRIQGNIDAAAGPVAPATASAIEDLLADQNRLDDVNALIRPVLEAKLVYGKQESATMRLGTHLWNLSIGAHD